MTDVRENPDRLSSGGMLPRAAAYIHKEGGRIFLELLVNFILPFAIYSYAEAPLGEVSAAALVGPSDPLELRRVCPAPPPRRALCACRLRHWVVAAGNAWRGRGTLPSA